MRKKKPCIDCGTEITNKKKHTRCQKCNGKSTRTDKTIIAESPEDYKREYRRRWAMKKKYNLTADEFDGYWIASRGRCYICKRIMRSPENKQGQALDVVAIDHDHKTGKMRGLLCNRCNKAIGLFEEDIKILEEAIKYLS
jgi:DNA-directed RNA polymerase subunit RPC12/RpoP